MNVPLGKHEKLIYSRQLTF